jgi:hypothetical protein
MGITIHYKGRTKDLDKVKKVVEYATFTAKNLNWQVIPIEQDGYVVEEIIKDKEGNVIYRFKTFYDKETYEKVGFKKGVPSKRIGVIINPPFRVESFIVAFYKDGDDWVLHDSTKTQVWSEKDLGNITAHEIIANMLTTIKQTWLPDLEIIDEGEYYVPLTKEERKKFAEEHITEEYRERYINLEPFNFERLIENQLGSARMISALASALAETLPEGWGVETPSWGIKKEKK